MKWSKALEEATHSPGPGMLDREDRREREFEDLASSDSLLYTASACTGDRDDEI